MNILQRVGFSVCSVLLYAGVKSGFLFVFEEGAFDCAFFCKQHAGDACLIFANAERFAVKTAGGCFSRLEKTCFAIKIKQLRNTLTVAFSVICVSVTENVIFAVNIFNGAVVVASIIQGFFIAVYANVAV